MCVMITDNELHVDVKKYRDNRVWVTKKVRMEAEKLRKSLNIKLQILLNYYSVITLILSVLTIKIPDEKLDMWNLIISISLLGITLTITFFNLDQKANEYKNCYLQLASIESDFDDLIYKIKKNTLEDDEIYTEFKNLKKSYTDILSISDNHSDLDYLEFKSKNAGFNLSFSETLKHYSVTWGFNLFYIIFIIFPIIVIIIKLR